MNEHRITESDSLHTHLDQKSTLELLQGINQEDQKVAMAVAEQIPAIAALTDAVVKTLANGGRLFYMGAGTSGRLGIVDASELPPTYGVDFGLVVGIIAGGDGAIRKAVEFAEDSWDGGWSDLQAHHITERDLVIGIAASGTTPYVIGALRTCRTQGIVTGCITCNPAAPIIAEADFPVAVVVGPEFVTGSTRMKAGTAQKLVLNMISTTAMIRLGKVKGNKMVDMQLTNHKLVDRGTRMIMEETGLPVEEARNLLQKHGQVRAAVDAWKQQQS